MSIKSSQQNIPSGWQETKLLDCLRIPSKLSGIKLSEYEKEGDFPVFDQGQDYISGFSSNKDLVVKDVPAILFGDHTRIVKYIKSPFVAGADGTKIFWAKDGFDPTFLYYLVLSQKIPNTGYNRHFKFFKDIKVIIPESKTEQQKIAEILGTVDEDIAKTKEVIQATEKLKRGLMQQLFTRGIGHTKFKETKIGQIPEDWELVKMKNICTVRQGLQIAISQRFSEYKEGRYKYITLKSIKENIYDYIESPKQSVICTKADVLMTRTGNTGVVVTDREGVFHNNFFLIDFDRSRVLKNYLVYYFLREDIKKIVLEKAGTTTIPDLNHDAFYGIDFVIPNLKEQKEIAEILSVIDEKILVNKKLKEKLTLLKKGLMQDLLSGKVRTNI